MKINEAHTITPYAALHFDTISVSCNPFSSLTYSVCSVSVRVECSVSVLGKCSVGVRGECSVDVRGECSVGVLGECSVGVLT